MADPIIPWMGGKRRLAKHILPLFTQHECYVEPFAGAAAIFFMKQPCNVEVLNDVNGELVNLYRVLQHHLEEFCKQYKYALVSRQMFEWEKLKVPATLTDIQRAARFYYLQKLSFGGKVVGQTYGYATTAPPKLNLLRVEEELSMAHLRLANVNVEHLDWKVCVQKYDAPHTLFYLDPPYWATEGYGVDFPLAEYDEMARLARSIKGRMIISVNDHPEMRRAFAGLPMDVVELAYSVGGGGKADRTPELIIRSSEEGFGGNLKLGF